jgi:hypothetical protein
MAVFKRPSNELSSYDKLVYAILCGHANRDGNAMLYVRTIAEEASCSERQVRRALSTLEARHLLIRRRQTAAGQGQTFNIYEVYGFREYTFKGNPPEGDGVPDSHPLPDSHTPPCQSDTSPLTEGQAPPDSQAGPINVFEQLLNNSSKEHIPPTPQRGEEREKNLESPKPQNQEYDTAGKAEPPKPDGEKELFEAIREAYNSTLPELPKAEKITASRSKVLRQRIRESHERKEPRWWEKFFSRVRNFPWPMGKNRDKWRADFDWLIGERGMQKILEGAFLPFRSGAALNEATDEWQELEKLEKKYTNAEGLLDAKAILREIDAAPRLRRLF